MDDLKIPNFFIQVGGVYLEFKVRASNFLEHTLEVILLNPDSSESEVRKSMSVTTCDKDCVNREAYLLAKRLANGLYTQFHVGAKPYYYYG